MPTNKIYFISDAHLGAGDDSLQRERELCTLLDSIKEDASKVVFLGDMFDFWFTYRYVVPRGFIRILGKMASLADAGVELHFFIGNHDMWLFDYLSSQMDITMHSDPEVLNFDGHTFLLGHGDGLGHLDKGFDIIRWIFHNPVNQWLFAHIPSGLTFGIAKAWSHSSRNSHIKKNPKIFEYQGDEREGIVIYCKEQSIKQNIDFCVFGHRHSAIVKELDNGTTYVNVGDWLINRDYAVYSNGKVVLKQWSPQV